MKPMTIALFASLALAGSAVAAEQKGPGASARTPGHEMQERGSAKGSPGASGYAPGHEMKGESTGSTGRTGGSGAGTGSGTAPRR